MIRELNRPNTERSAKPDRGDCGGRPGFARLRSELVFDLRRPPRDGEIRLDKIRFLKGCGNGP
jgi:hypothetical protein